MSEENTEERLGEIQDQIDAYARRVQALEEDLGIVIRFSIGILEQARLGGHGTSPETPEFRQKCRRFFERYRSDL